MSSSLPAAAACSSGSTSIRAAALSADYWAGWADQVNCTPSSRRSPRRAAACSNRSAPRPVPVPVSTGGNFRPDPRGRDGSARCPDGRGRAQFDVPCVLGRRFRPLIAPDWSVFCRRADSADLADRSRVLRRRRDRRRTTIRRRPANPGGGVGNALDFMFRVERWQPGLPVMATYGIHPQRPSPAATGSRAVKADAHAADERILSSNFSIPQGPSRLHRALPPAHRGPGRHLLTRAEAKIRLSDAIWTRSRSGRTAPPSRRTRTSTTSIRNSANGTSDGQTAFTTAPKSSSSLRTRTVFFALDNFDPDAVSGTALTHAEVMAPELYRADQGRPGHGRRPPIPTSPT